MQELDISNMVIADIRHDELYYLIEAIAREEPVKTILEIGSCTGQGSTEAFVSGIQKNPHQPTLFCIEGLAIYFSELQKRYADLPNVKCYYGSTISLEQFPTEAEVIDFYNTVPTNLNSYPLDMVMGWYQRDYLNIRDNEIPTHIIQTVKQENQIETFDAVFVDGSEFSGRSDFEEIYGAKLILLDDINAFKNYDSHQKLLADPNYVLIAQDASLRNGYSLFKRIDFALGLREINYVIFPDWSQPEDAIATEIASILKVLTVASNKHQITLLIDSYQMPPDDINLMMSGIMMELILQEGLEPSDDLADELNISVVSQLSVGQWEKLRSHLTARIQLTVDDPNAIAQASAESLPLLTIQDL